MMTPKRKTNPTYYIVCEGETTEPNFFKEFREFLIQQKYLDNREQIKIFPVPPKEKSPAVKRGAYKGRKRKTKNTDDVSCLEEELKGPPPLNWVLKAASEKGIYDSLWAVFDKDQHPKAKEAFAEAKKDAENPVHIAFSSICFEYYLLLHFEYYYHAFEKSECRKGKKTFYCCSDHFAASDPTLDCRGTKCVNGYARKHNYWQETKKDKSTFNLIKNKLWYGIYNANLLRIESDAQEKDKPIWERNPYVTVDYLITTLLGYKQLKLGNNQTIKTLEIKYEPGKLVFTNKGKITLLILPEYLSEYSFSTHKSTPILEKRFFLYAEDSYTFELNDAYSGKIIFFKDENTKIFLVKP